MERAGRGSELVQGREAGTRGAGPSSAEVVGVLAMLEAD